MYCSVHDWGLPSGNRKVLAIRGLPLLGNRQHCTCDLSLTRADPRAGPCPDRKFPKHQKPSPPKLVVPMVTNCCGLGGPEGGGVRPHMQTPRKGGPCRSPPPPPPAPSPWKRHSG